MGHPAGRDEARFTHMPAQGIDRPGSSPTSSVRTRNTIIAACCSADLTGTTRIVGRVTASQIASASAASVLPRLTKGFTYCGGISLTSWPRAEISRAR